MKHTMLWFCKKNTVGLVECLVEAMHSYYAVHGHYPTHALAHELQVAAHCAKNKIQWNGLPLLFEKVGTIPAKIEVKISHGLTPNHILLEEK